MPKPLILTVGFLAFSFIYPIVYKWILVPVKLKKHDGPTIEPQFEPTSLEDLTAEQRAQIGDHVGQFKQEGFDVSANFTTKSGSRDVRTVVVLLVNHETGDTAQLILTATKLVRTSTVHIRSDFADKSGVGTGASAQIGIFPKDRMVDSANFRWVKQVASLAEAHRRRLARLRLDTQARTFPRPGEELEYMRKSWSRDLCRFVECGYYRRDENAGVLRKTWKGTFLTTWKLQSPVKQLRIAAANRTGRKLWVELGMNRWEPASRPAAADYELEGVPAEVTPLSSASTGKITYEPTVAPGEMHIDRQDAVTTVRLGRPSVGSYLLMRWAAVCWIVFGCVLLAAMLPRLWEIYQLQSYQVRLQRPPIEFLLSLVVFPYLLIASIVSVGRGLRRTRGTSTLAASHQGLQFANAPSGRRHGSIRREDLQTLVVVRREFHLTGSLHQLEAIVRDELFRQPLLVATDARKLNEAQQAVVSALGIQNAPEPSRANVA